MAEFNFSVLSPADVGTLEDSVLVEALHTALQESDADRWTARPQGPWYAAAPTGYTEREQGWKLHVSATVASAERVLRQALPVLLAEDSAFKFAATLDQVALLNTRHTSRGHSGKVLTIYPDSDDAAVRIAEKLHRATAGLDGPMILSDRPYQPGSLVHYRYGAFTEQRQFSHDGFYTWVIRDPDGNPVEDRRVGRYTPPDWVTCPFPTADDTPRRGNSGKARAGGSGVLIGGRFHASEAIRHTNRGGVYRAVDTDNEAPVVVKEARPHVGTDADGRDERDHLRAEARALEQLATSNTAPQVSAIFEQARHLFLVEDLVPGVSLGQWVADRLRENGWRRDVPRTLPLARRLVTLLRTAHRAGLVLRDFNPNNIMVRPDGALRLVDLELAVVSGTEDSPLRVGTPGFSAPEQLTGAAPEVTADYFGLGATLCLAMLGTAPFSSQDASSDDTVRERLHEWLAVRWATTDLPEELRDLIEELMDPAPARRATPEHAERTLAGLQQPTARPSRTEQRLSEADWNTSVDGIVAHLVDTMRPDEDRLWPMSCAHGSPDPCSLQHGAAGVLGTLTRCAELNASPVAEDRVHSALAEISDWILQRLDRDADRPPSLYFGLAGLAWSLHDAGTLLGSDRLVTRSRELAHQLPESTTNPDLTHGTAGIATTLTRLWWHSGDTNLLRRAERAADTLVDTADEGPDGLTWGAPAEHLAHLAGRRYYGFAHGSSGTAYGLLIVALATGRSDYLDVARRVGKTLVNQAVVTDDIALWGAGTGDEPTAPHWCHGASGIGTFLVRLYRATGDEELLRYAEKAARAVVENAPRNVLAQCHGLAGNGDFLLDMAEATGDTYYHAMAHRFARLAFTSRIVREDRTVFPDEHGGLAATWGDGMTGLLGFLLRLRHRTPRLWMADELLPQGAST